MNTTTSKNQEYEYTMRVKTDEILKYINDGLRGSVLGNDMEVIKFKYLQTNKEITLFISKRSVEDIDRKARTLIEEVQKSIGISE
jgi:hypothetical protein